ncbi:MAG: ABC transporter ATP-binding protein [Armatimonadota bacterium]|nr:ABC transporter ATP-binding protein [Armatimonadota bacterium]MDR7531786.1 ABC transporter ATP-binding protein [Armatimonadota bacterium]MDR7534869.1 ABC transporter ATP-binding protein [Armatimonadota bacterium]
MVGGVALEIRDLTVAYGHHEVLRDLNLVVPEGQFVGLVGPSGCGKSTLLRAVAGLVPPARGTLAVFGRAVTGCAPEVGMLFQEDALLPWRTARDNVALGLRFRGMAAGDARAAARAWLERLGLGAFADHFPHELSGGMKKRVALAQVLAPQPRLLLMDEPFASLDAIVRTVLEAEFARLVRAEGLTVVLVTHDLEEALLLADRVAVLSAGPAARILRVYDVPFPHPRDPVHLRGAPVFGRLLARLWGDLRAEVGRMGWEVPA